MHLDQVSVVYGEASGNQSRARETRSFTALYPVDLTIRKGEFTVLLGPSGAGKSSLLRCFNLLTRPASGLVRDFEGGALDSPRKIRAHRRRTGMVFQQHQLIRRLSAFQNVLTGRIGYHSFWRALWPLPPGDQRIALECLDRVGLLSKALQRIDQLSGGEQQRVGFARALAQQPRLMLADEPVASLDPVTAQSLMRLLRAICREDNITAVVSLHQVDLAREFADRIIGLHSGRILFDGPVETLDDSALDLIYGQAVRSPSLPPEPVAAETMA